MSPFYPSHLFYSSAFSSHPNPTQLPPHGSVCVPFLSVLMISLYGGPFRYECRSDHEQLNPMRKTNTDKATPKQRHTEHNNICSTRQLQQEDHKPNSSHIEKRKPHAEKWETTHAFLPRQTTTLLALPTSPPSWPHPPPTSNASFEARHGGHRFGAPKPGGVPAPSAGRGGALLRRAAAQRPAPGPGARSRARACCRQRAIGRAVGWGGVICCEQLQADSNPVLVLEATGSSPSWENQIMEELMGLLFGW